MSLDKKIQSGGHQPCLKAVPRAVPRGFQDNGSREASAGVMVIADEGGCAWIKAQLERQNFPALVTSARNKDELQLAASAGDWDIVLIDLPVPFLDLPEALDYFRIRMPSVPVILLASRPNEARARELLPGGSWDCVLKDRLDRLVPAIDRSLRRSLLQRRAAAAGTVPEKLREPIIEKNACRSDIADPFKGTDAAARGATAGSGAAEYRQLEQSLKEAEAKFKSLAEQSLVGTYILQHNTLKYANLRFAEMFGCRPEDIIDKISLRDLIVPEDRELIEARIRRCASRCEPAIHEELRGLKKTGDTLNVEVFGSRAVYQGRPAIVGIALDVTEKMKLEQQLRQAQKMEAVGQLTIGIVHEFNNMLTAIVGFASLLSEKMKPDDPAKSFAKHILATGDQAAKLIRSLLTFGRKQETDFRVVDVNDIIRRTGKLIRLILGCKVALRVSTSARQLLVNADQGQIEQVLINLATNAVDAMPDGGVLSIETDVVSGDLLDEAFVTMREHYAAITVIDTGVGMDEKTRDRIFEPFFTTKEAERGTGLGLSIVARIIQQHKGAVCCESRPGFGSCFKIYLPLVAFQRKPEIRPRAG